MMEILVSIISPSACSSLTLLGIELGLLPCGPTTSLDLMALKKKKKKTHLVMAVTNVSF